MADPVSVVAALSAVMADVQAVHKNDRNTSQNFSFRGIDAVVNAVGPALRSHGVVVLPRVVSQESDSYTTRNGAVMRSLTVEVEYTFVGPDGGTLTCSVVGEASDAGDKAAPKAMSVAFRTALLQALCIPTDEPDPDSESHERAAPPAEPEPAPEHDWEYLGWESAAEHDAARAEVTEKVKGLPEDVQAELREWWRAAGWAWPLSMAQLGEWEHEIESRTIPADH